MVDFHKAIGRRGRDEKDKLSRRNPIPEKVILCTTFPSGINKTGNPNSAGLETDAIVFLSRNGKRPNELNFILIFVCP